MTATDHLPALAQTFAAQLRPQANPLSFSDFCDRMRLPDGDAQGQRWEWRRHPAQRALIEAASSGRWRVMIPLGPVQDGKTLTGLVAPSAWCASELHKPQMAAWPDRFMAGKMWRGKLRPALQAIQGGRLLPETGPGSGTGAPDDVLLGGGSRLYLLGAGARNEAGQAGVTAWLGMIDEVDSIRRRHLRLLLQRLASYGGDSMAWLMSTIKSDLASPIIEAWERSTACVIQVPCPSCGHVHRLSWDAITYDPSSDISARQSVRWACPACSTLHDDDQRLAALERAVIVGQGQHVDAAGRVVGDLVESEAYGIRWSSLDSPRRALGDLAVLHREAVHAARFQNDHELLRQFYRDHLVEQYQADVEEAPRIVETVVATRSALGTTPRGQVPPGISHLTVAVDCQLRRHYWQAMAHYPDGRMAIIDWHGRGEALCGDQEQPTPAQRHALLDRLHARFQDGWPDHTGRIHRPVLIGCDVATFTDELLGWLRLHWGEWVALRGIGEALATQIGRHPGSAKLRLPGWLEIRQHPDRYLLHLVDTHQVRAYVHNGLIREPEVGGALLLPPGVATDSNLARHLCAEVRQVTDRGVVWVTRHVRNDLLDCAVYNAALGRLYAHRIGQNPSQAQPESPHQSDDADQHPPAAIPPRRTLPQPSAAGSWISPGGGGSSGGGWL